MADFVVQGWGKVLDEIYVRLRLVADFEKVISRIKKTRHH